MAAPLIGVTTYHREREGRPRFTLPDAYVEAVRDAGAIPVLLTPGEARARELLARLDGLVLSGGGDLDPRGFGGADHDSVYFVCGERDDFERDLVRTALSLETPMLAICRGLQLLNVALGGDIHVHLPDVVGEDVPHRESQDAPTRHGVRVAPGSRLAGQLGGDRLDEVASWHHQAVARLGEGLAPVAWAPDDTVEALELDGAPQVAAVQWHPELQIEAGSPQRRLFSWLVGLARGG